MYIYLQHAWAHLDNKSNNLFLDNLSMHFPPGETYHNCHHHLCWLLASLTGEIICMEMGEINFSLKKKIKFKKKLNVYLYL